MHTAMTSPQTNSIRSFELYCNIWTNEMSTFRNWNNIEKKIKNSPQRPATRPKSE